jgi:hypothetical protein
VQQPRHGGARLPAELGGSVSPSPIPSPSPGPVAFPGAAAPVPEGAEHSEECRRATWPYHPWDEATECCPTWWSGPKFKAAKAAQEQAALEAVELPPEPPGPNAWLSGYAARAAEARAAAEPPQEPRRYGIYRE